MDPWLEYHWLCESMRYEYNPSLNSKWPFVKKTTVGPTLPLGLSGIVILCKNGTLLVHYQVSESEWRSQSLAIPSLEFGLLDFGRFIPSDHQQLNVFYQRQNELSLVHVKYQPSHETPWTVEIGESFQFTSDHVHSWHLLDMSRIVMVLDSKIQLWKKEESMDFFSNSASSWTQAQEYIFSSRILCHCPSENLDKMAFGLENGEIYQIEIESWTVSQSSRQTKATLPMDEELHDLFGDVEDVVMDTNHTLAGKEKIPIDMVYSPSGMGVLVFYDRLSQWHSFDKSQKLPFEELLSDMFKVASLCLLERKSGMDVIDTIAELSKVHSNLPEEILLKLTGTFTSRLDAQYPVCSLSSDDARLLRFQVHLYRIVQGKKMQYANTFATIQLLWTIESIYSIFPSPIKILDYVGLCLKNESQFEVVLKDPSLILSKAQCIRIGPLISWIMDFSVYLLRHAYIFFFSKKVGTGSDYFVLDSSQPTAMIFFLNTDLILLLLRALTLVRLVRLHLQNVLTLSATAKDAHAAILRHLDHFISKSHLKEASMIQFLKDIVGKETVLPKMELHRMFITSTILESQLPLIPKIKTAFTSALEHMFGTFKFSLEQNSWHFEPMTSERDILNCLFTHSHSLNLLPVPKRTWNRVYVSVQLDVLSKSNLWKSENPLQCMECGHFSASDEYESCCCGGTWKRVSLGRV